MKRLSEGICKSSRSDLFPLVLAVSEDWAPGGAGNGLGTLYAYRKACALAKEKHGMDLEELLGRKEISAALYHTAGKGTRLAPLPASENNNKPGVKLPFCHSLGDGTSAPLTVLEAVVKQTGLYAPSRLGRLSVFWGDQDFIPSAPFAYTPTHHVDIMCTLLGDTAPTAEEWAEQGLDKYGVIAVSASDQRNAAQVEKVDHATAVRILQVLGDIGQVGPSLGSFSVSAQMLNGLCHEFSQELTAKSGKFDTDPHFWMPFTLPLDDYVFLMQQKGVDAHVSQRHHARMTRMKHSFPLNGMGLFGAVDVGKDACWWDYGQLKKYFTNNIKILQKDHDALLLRKFLQVTSNIMNSHLGDALQVDDISCIFSSNIRSGSVSESLLASVDALSVHAQGAIIINCTARKIVAHNNAILYNLVDSSPDGIVAKQGDVLVSVTDQNGDITTITSHLDICGGQAWKQVLEGNLMSFEQIHDKNLDSNVVAIEDKKKELFKKASQSFADE